MKQHLFFFILMLLIAACKDESQQGKPVAAEMKAETLSGLYADSSYSSMKIMSKDSDDGYKFVITETNYKIAYVAPHGDNTLNHYFAKYTSTTKSCTGCEEQKRNIKVELNSFDSPKKTEVTIQQDCDDLTLDVDTYKTVKYGCCGAEDQLAIYDYDNKLIIKGDSKIITGKIPNSHLKIYAAFKSEFTDSTFLGTIYFAYTSSDQYAIKIKSKPLPSEQCNPFSPEILITSSNSRDKYDKESNAYTFWSLDKVENKNQIDNIKLKIAFECDRKVRLDAINIPIIKGLPFGKEEKNQEIVYGENRISDMHF